jgi:hypothetical protein
VASGSTVRSVHHQAPRSLSLPPHRGSRPGVAPRGIGGGSGEERGSGECWRRADDRPTSLPDPQVAGQVAAGSRRSGRDEHDAAVADRARRTCPGQPLGATAPPVPAPTLSPVLIASMRAWASSTPCSSWVWASSHQVEPQMATPTAAAPRTAHHRGIGRRGRRDAVTAYSRWTWPSQWSVAAGVEWGQLPFDIHRDRPEEVGVLSVRWGNVGEHLVVDAPSLGTHRLYREAVVLRGPGHYRVGHHGQAPGLLGLLLQVPGPDRALVRVDQVTTQCVQALTLVELPGDLAAIGRVG